MDFLNHRSGFLSEFSSFLLYSVQQRSEETCKRFREFEETEISRQSCREVTLNSKEENLNTCVWISSKNSASGLFDKYVFYIIRFTLTW